MARNGKMRASKAAPTIQPGKNHWTSGDVKTAHNWGKSGIEISPGLKKTLEGGGLGPDDFIKQPVSRPGGSNDDLQKVLSGKLKGV